MRRDRVVELMVRRGGLLGLAAFALYAWLAPTWLLGGDNGEFATIGAHGGVPHPSGYPLYVLWLRLLSWLPAASPAHAAALATAILGGAHVVMLHAACRAWGARPAAATLAVGVYAAAPLAMLIYSQAEVFALNGLAASTILWLAAPAGPVTGGRRTVVLGLAGGLALANHLTAVLVAPIGLFGAVQGLREATGRRLAVGAAAAGAFAIGLTPYLYFLIAPSGGASWGHIDGLGDVLDHALRREYGSGSLVPHDVPAQPLANGRALVATLARTWWWILLAIGVVTLVARSVRGAHRPAWLALAATVLAASAVVLRFNLEPSGVELWIVERFHLLPALILAIPVAVGLDGLVARIDKKLELPTRTRTLIVVACFLALPVAAAPGLDRVGRGHSPAVDRAVHNILGALPPDAVVITGGDHLHFGFLYARHALGARPDVVHMTFDLLGLPWYQARVGAQLGHALIPPGPGYASVRLAEAVMATGRPLLVDGDQRHIVAAFANYPHGPLLRILPRGTGQPPLDEIVATNRALLEAFDLRYPHPSRDDGWASLVHRMYARWWRTLATGLANAGRSADADEARALARSLGPS